MPLVNISKAQKLGWRVILAEGKMRKKQHEVSIGDFRWLKTVSAFPVCFLLILGYGPSDLETNKKYTMRMWIHLVCTPIEAYCLHKHVI